MLLLSYPHMNRVNVSTILFLAVPKSRIKHQLVQLQNVVHVRGVFQKYAERFHRMFAIAAMLIIFHVRHTWYMLIKYR